MKYAVAAVVFVLIATLALVGANIPPASAQGNLPAPTKVTAVNGPNAGEAIIIWNTVADAAYYRIGWVSYADYLTVTEEGRPWLEAFVFVDVANRGQTSYTVTRLEPGVRHAFLVASNATQYGEPQWSEWSLLTLNSATSSCPAATAAPTAPVAATPLSNEELTRRVKPALAQIVVTGSDGEMRGGTGFVVRSDGLLVTNRHVIDDADSVTVNMQDLDGQLFQYTGQVLGRGILADLAVVQLPAGRTYTTLPLGDSDAVVGLAEVTAWGYPTGSISGTYPTITRGIISSKGIFEDVRGLQTDAAINPGNSGGPLIDAYGRVIGVNTAKIVSDRVDNIGFAIASNEVSSRLDTLAAGGPTQAVYRNARSDYGYSVTIPKGWYLSSETELCTSFYPYHSKANAAICSYDLTGEFASSGDKLAAFAWWKWNDLQESARERGFPTFERVSFGPTGSGSNQRYRLEYRVQTDIEHCISSRVMLVALSSAYPGKPNGFTWRGGVCENSLSQYAAERQALLNSFQP